MSHRQLVGLPAYTENLLHQLSTIENGTTYPPINTRGTGQKKLYQPGQILPVVSGLLPSSTFHFMWTNGEAQTDQGVYLSSCLWVVPSSFSQLKKLFQNENN